MGTASWEGRHRWLRRGSGLGDERVDGGREPVAMCAAGLDVFDWAVGGLPGPAVEDLGRCVQAGSGQEMVSGIGCSLVVGAALVGTLGGDRVTGRVLFAVSLSP